MKTKITTSLLLLGLFKLNAQTPCTFTTSISSSSLATICGSDTLEAPTFPAWEQKANFAGNVRTNAAGFSIGNKCYMGTGQGVALYNDFWEYDPAADTWTQKANVPGVGRYLAVGFSINGLGYIGMGWGGNYMSDLREYDPVTNTWSAKASISGAREGAIAFTVGNLAYVGLGFNGGYYTDLRVFNPLTNSWTTAASFPGGGRARSVSFSIAGRGYVGTGTNGSAISDFYEYNPVNDSWTQKSSAGIPARFAASGFAIGSKGYLGIGHDGTNRLGDFYEYNPVTDVWTQKGNFGGNPQYNSVGLSMGNRGYIALGNDGLGIPTLWKYTPDYSYSWSNGATSYSTVALSAGVYSVQIINPDSCIATASVTLNIQANPTLTVADGTICAGNSFSISPSGANTYSITGDNYLVSPTATAVYTVSGTSTAGCTNSTETTLTVTVKNDPLPAVMASVSNSIICEGQLADLTASGALTYLWSNNQTGSTVSVMPAVTTSYTVTGTDANGCTNTSMVLLTVGACTSIDQLLPASSVVVYPNPGNGMFTLSNAGQCTIRIIDPSGRLVNQSSQVSAEHEIDLTHENNGLYFMHINTERGTHVIKIIKN